MCCLHHEDASLASRNVCPSPLMADTINPNPLSKAAAPPTTPKLLWLA